MTGPKVRNRTHALLGGYALVAAGAWLLYDAYERRGRKRPWLLGKLAP